jgi:hypothetical protein
MRNVTIQPVVVYQTHPPEFSFSYDREITMVSYVGLSMVSRVTRMTMAKDREYEDSLKASRNRFKSKYNLNQSPWKSLIVTSTVLSLLVHVIVESFPHKRLMGKYNLRRSSTKYRYVIEGSYRV